MSTIEPPPHLKRREINYTHLHHQDSDAVALGEKTPAFPVEHVIFTLYSFSKGLPPHPRVLLTVVSHSSLYPPHTESFDFYCPLLLYS